MSAITRFGLRFHRSLVPMMMVTMLLTAACNVGFTSATPSTTGVEATRETAIGASIEDGVSDYQSYVGGKAGAADKHLSKITIGWVNVEHTANGAPEATRAAQAAVTYVNTKLGGIGGHPLALKPCIIASSAEEEGQPCGKKLLDDAAVQGIAFGNVYVGDQSFNSLVAGKKPVLASVASGRSISTAKNTYILFGDLSHVFSPWGTYARNALHAKTAALIHTNTANDRAAAEAVRRGMEDAGIAVKSVGFDPQATDLLGPVTSANAHTADVTVPITAGRGCVAIAKALKQLGSTKPVVSTPICLSGDVAKSLGGDLPQWTYGVAQTLPTDSSAADSRTFRKAAAEAGLPAPDQSKVWAAASWSLIIIYAKLMNQIGASEVTPETLTRALAAFHGPVVMGAPKVKCGQYPGTPAVCNNQTRFYAYRGKGVFVPRSGWLAPPA